MKKLLCLLVLLAANAHAAEPPPVLTYKFSIVDEVTGFTYQWIEGSTTSDSPWSAADLTAHAPAAVCTEYEPPAALNAKFTTGSTYLLRPLRVETNGKATVAIELVFSKLNNLRRDKYGPCDVEVPDIQQSYSAQTVSAQPDAKPIEVGRTPDGHLVLFQLLKNPVPGV